MGLDETLSRRDVTVLQMRRAAIDETGFERFVEAMRRVPEEFQPVLGPTLEFQAKLLSTSPDQLRKEAVTDRTPSFAVSDVRNAEVFAHDAGLFAVIARQSAGRYLRRRVEGQLRVELAPGPGELWLYAMTTDPAAMALSTLETLLNSAFEVELAPHFFRSARFDELKEEQGLEPPAEISPGELAAAKALADRAARSLALAIKASGGLLVSDLAKQLNGEADDVGDLQARLASSGLIAADVVVICTRNQAQAIRVPSRDVLERLTDEGLQCACGRPITEERIEEAVTITDRGRALLDGSRWLSLLVVEELAEFGIPRDRILIEQQVGGDELDCLADVSGELVLFELKDKEFSLGNAYSFGAKIAVIRPHHPVIVTTEHVGGDAKEHFQRAELAGERGRGRPVDDDDGATRVRYIEGIDDLASRLRTLAGEIYRRDAVNILGDALPLAALDPLSVYSAAACRPRDVGSRDSPSSRVEDQPDAVSVT